VDCGLICDATNVRLVEFGQYGDNLVCDTRELRASELLCEPWDADAELSGHVQQSVVREHRIPADFETDESGTRVGAYTPVSKVDHRFEFRVLRGVGEVVYVHRSGYCVCALCIYEFAMIFSCFNVREGKKRA
jgi:hypothetical protein